MAEPFSVIVLAAQRDGRLDPLAAEAGVSHKCLVPIGGKPLLAHVLEALAQVEGIESVRVAVEAGAEALLRPIAEGFRLPVVFTPAAPNLADSVYAAAEGAPGHFVVTTADNVLLTPGAVRGVADRLVAGDDVVVAFARKEAVLAAHPEGQRNFYRFRDGGISNCNLYGLSKRGLGAAESFRGGGHFFAHPLRIARAFGVTNLVLMRLAALTVEAAMRRLGRRFGVAASAVFLDDGAHAIDVDNARTYRIASLLLEKRAAAPLSLGA